MKSNERRGGAASALLAFERVDVRVHRKQRTILSALSVDIDRGVTVVTGPNGAGKSTFIKVAAGLIAPSSGSAEVLGEALLGRRTRRLARKSIGYVPQHTGAVRGSTPRSLCEYGAWLHRLPRQRAAAQSARCLELLELGHVADAPLRTLSGGTIRRSFLAMALVHDPSVVILDEPFAGLDQKTRDVFINVLEHRADDAAIVLSSHDDLSLWDRPIRVLALDGGTLVEDRSVRGNA